MQLNRVIRQVVGAAATLCVSSMAFAANYNFVATFTDFGTLANPQPDVFTIGNYSDAGINILQVTIDLSGASNSPVFDTLDGASPNYAYGAMTGAPVTGTNPLDVGFVVPSAAQQAAWEEATSITLDFTDFQPGEIFGFLTDVDDLVDFFLAGFEFAGTSFTVVFEDSLGTVRTDSALFQAVAGPPINDAFAQVAGFVPIPVPGALLLMMSALGGLGFARRRNA